MSTYTVYTCIYSVFLDIYTIWVYLSLQHTSNNSKFAACIASTSASNGVPKSSTWAVTIQGGLQIGCVFSHVFFWKKREKDRKNQRKVDIVISNYHNRYKSLLSIEYNRYHVQYRIYIYTYIYIYIYTHIVCVCDFVTVTGIIPCCGLSSLL